MSKIGILGSRVLIAGLVFDHSKDKVTDAMGLTQEEMEGINPDFDVTNLDSTQLKFVLIDAVDTDTAAALLLGLNNGDFDKVQDFSSKSKALEYLLANLDDVGYVTLVYAGFVDRIKTNQARQMMAKLAEGLDEEAVAEGDESEPKAGVNLKKD